MKNVLYIFFLVILFSACKSGEGETVEFSDIAKPSEKYGNTDTSSVVKAEILPVYFDSISTFSQQFSDSLTFDHNKIFTLDTLIYPDRFGAKKADKWYFLSANDSLVFMRWEFKNNIQTQNTFFNWLDCYGPKCKSIAVADKVNFSKRATLFLVDDKELIFIESNRKIDAEKLILILSNLRKQKQWKYFVLQTPKGKASWKEIDKEGITTEIKLLLTDPLEG